MKSWKMIFMASCILLLGGCSDLAGAKLLLPERYGLTKVEDGLYIEKGSSEESKSHLRSAMSDAEAAIKAAYGSVQSKPIVNACLTEECYRKFGGMGSKAKIYGSYILLSPRGFDWHFLAHEWSHDELRHRLTLTAWYRLPQWFDEGVAVAISEAPEHSEAHWEYLGKENVSRPDRAQLMTYKTLREWLNAVNLYGETENADRKARGESEIRPVYTAAGHELRLWLGERPSDKLLPIIEKLNSGQPFDIAYSSK